jgi:hypothetical protein
MARNISKRVDADLAPSQYFAIASINLALTNDQLNGQLKHVHMALVKEVSRAAMTNTSVIGIAFSGVGSDEGLDEASHPLFMAAIREGFRSAGVPVQPVIRYEACCATAIALRNDVDPIKHGVLTDLAGPNKGRTAQWVDVVCEDGGNARLINTSQSAVETSYGLTTRKKVVTDILRFAGGYDLESGALVCCTNGVVVGDLKADKTQIASYGKKINLDGRMFFCAAAGGWT